MSITDHWLLHSYHTGCVRIRWACNGHPQTFLDDTLYNSLFTQQLADAVGGELVVVNRMCVVDIRTFRDEPTEALARELRSRLAFDRLREGFRPWATREVQYHEAQLRRWLLDWLRPWVNARIASIPLPEQWREDYEGDEVPF